MSFTLAETNAATSAGSLETRFTARKRVAVQMRVIPIEGIEAKPLIGESWARPSAKVI